MIDIKETRETWTNVEVAMQSHGEVCTIVGVLCDELEAVSDILVGCGEFGAREDPTAAAKAVAVRLEALRKERDALTVAANDAIALRLMRDDDRAKLTVALAKNVELACANQTLKAGVRALRMLANIVIAYDTAVGDGAYMEVNAWDALLTTTRRLLAETADLAPAQEAPTIGGVSIVANPGVSGVDGVLLMPQRVGAGPLGVAVHHNTDGLCGGTSERCACSTCVEGRRERDTDKSPVSDE